MIFFTINPNLKYFFGGGGLRGAGARVSDFFLQRIQILKKVLFWRGGGRGAREELA